LSGNFSRETPTSELLVLEDFEFVDILRILEPHVHPDERLPSFGTQEMPRFRFGQKFADGRLGQTQDGFTKCLLSNVVKLQDFLDSARKQKSRLR
jgi:hypothetical protein